MSGNDSPRDKPLLVSTPDDISGVFCSATPILTKDQLFQTTVTRYTETRFRRISTQYYVLPPRSRGVRKVESKSIFRTCAIKGRVSDHAGCLIITDLRPTVGINVMNRGTTF